VPANYATTTTSTALTQQPTKTNNSQTIRNFASSLKSAAPLQPAVTAFYHPGLAVSGQYSMASAAVQPAGTIGYNIPTASNFHNPTAAVQQAVTANKYSSQAAAIQQAVTANQHSLPTAAVQQAVTANQHSSSAEAFKGKDSTYKGQYLEIYQIQQIIKKILVL
jgi:hypothetical protein